VLRQPGLCAVYPEGPKYFGRSRSLSALDHAARQPRIQRNLTAAPARGIFAEVLNQHLASQMYRWPRKSYCGCRWARPPGPCAGAARTAVRRYWRKPLPSLASTLTEQTVRTLLDSISRANLTRARGNGAFAVSFLEYIALGSSDLLRVMPFGHSRRQTTNISRRLNAAWLIAISAGNIHPILAQTPGFTRREIGQRIARGSRKPLQGLWNRFVLGNLRNKQIDPPAITSAAS